MKFFLEQWIWLDKYNTKEICRSFRKVIMDCFVFINSVNRIKWFLLKTSVWPFFGRTFLFETISILSSFCFKFLQIIYNIEICFFQDDQLQRINVLWFRKLISELSIVTTCSSVALMGPWYSGTQCGMRIPRQEFKSQRVPWLRDVDLGYVNFTIA